MTIAKTMNARDLKGSAMIRLAVSSVLILAALWGKDAASDNPKSGPAPSDSWDRERCLTTGAGPRRLSYNFARCVATDDAGRVHVVWYEARDGKEHAFYKRSADEGKTWETAVSLSDTSERMPPGNPLLPAVASAGSNVYAVWHELQKGKASVYFRRSTDGGGKWGPSQRLSNSPGNAAISAVAATGKDVHVVWVDMRRGPGEIRYRRSTDDGATWEDEKRLPDKTEKWNKSMVSYVPSIAALGDTVVLAWVDTRDGNEEEYVKVSNDRGKTWGKDVRLTNHPANSWAPSVAISGKNLHLVWFDQMDAEYQPADAEKMLDEVMKLLGLPPLGPGPSGVHVPNPELAARQRASERLQMIQKQSPAWIKGGGDAQKLQRILREFHEMAQPAGLVQAEAKLNEALELVGLPLDVTPKKSDPAVARKRIQDKIKKVQETGPNWVKKGGDVKKLQSLLQEFERLMRAGEGAGYIEKEEKLDEAIKLMGLKYTPGPLTAIPLIEQIQARQMRVRVRMRKIQAAAPAWVQKGGDPKKLDSMLKEFQRAMEKATKQWEIYYRRSTDAGATWGTTVRLTHSGAFTHRPSVAVAGDEVHVVWWGDRSGNNQVYYKRSTDGGKTWSGDVRLTNAGKDPRFPGVAISRNFIHVVWLDSRDGSPHVYYQRKKRK